MTEHLNGHELRDDARCTLCDRVGYAAWGWLSASDDVVLLFRLCEECRVAA